MTETQTVHYATREEHHTICGLDIHVWSENDNNSWTDNPSAVTCQDCLLILKETGAGDGTKIVSGSARYILEVMAGLIPNQPEAQFTQRWGITGEEWAAWNEAAGKFNPDGPMDWLKLPDVRHAELIARVQSYALMLMLSGRVNWVRMDWIQV